MQTLDLSAHTKLKKIIGWTYRKADALGLAGSIWRQKTDVPALSRKMSGGGGGFITHMAIYPTICNIGAFVVANPPPSHVLPICERDGLTICHGAHAAKPIGLFLYL